MSEESEDKKFQKKIEETTITVSYLRGLAITKAVDIELMVGSLITNFFIKSNKHSKFSNMVLSDPYFSFGLKISILRKILNEIKWRPYKGFKDDLWKLQKLRNRFAHSSLFGFEGQLIYDNGEKPMEIKSAKEMFDEFIQLYSRILEELEKVFWQIIGKQKPSRAKRS